MTRPLLLEKEIRIQGYDIDVLGIVSNIVYLRWFEDLRMHFLDNYYPFQELYADHMSPVLTDTQVKYHYPLTIHDETNGRVWLSNISKSRWECSFEIVTEKKIHTTGVQSGYFIDTQRMRPTRIPERFQELYDREMKD